MRLPTARSSVIVQQDQGEFYLVDTDGGEVFQVNQTAARIFGFCQSGGTLDSAVAAFSEGLAVPGQEALIREDILTMVRSLCELGLCAETPAA